MKKEHKRNTYAVTDLRLATFLRIQNFKLLRIDRKPGGIGVFVFEDRADREQLVTSFLNKKQTVSAITKSFPYSPKPATLDSKPSSEVEVPGEQSPITATLYAPATLIRMPHETQVTGTGVDDDEPAHRRETVGRTKYDLLWHWRDKLNLYIILPFIYITAVSALGQLKLEKSSIVLHACVTVFIYVVVFLGKTFGRDRGQS